MSEKQTILIVDDSMLNRALLADMIGDAYRILYAQGLNVSDALEEIESSLEDTPERRRILDFIRNSKRGIVKG